MVVAQIGARGGHVGTCLNAFVRAALASADPAATSAADIFRQHGADDADLEAQRAANCYKQRKIYGERSGIEL